MCTSSIPLHYVWITILERKERKGRKREGREKEGKRNGRKIALVCIVRIGREEK